MRDKNRLLQNRRSPLAKLEALMEERDPLYQSIIADFVVSTRKQKLPRLWQTKIVRKRRSLIAFISVSSSFIREPDTHCSPPHDLDLLTMRISHSVQQGPKRHYQISGISSKEC